MQKMIKGNVIIEIKEKDILKAELLGFIKYDGIKIVNAEVDFDE
ncbi:MAG: hypothetical protein ACI31R_05370 [Bacilli bacterium]